VRNPLKRHRARRPRSTRWRALALALVTTLGLGMLVVAPQNAAAAGVQCQATYATTWDSGTGFGASVTVKNVGSTAWTSWTLGYAYAGNQTLQSGWNGTWTQTGNAVTVNSLSWNANVAAGATVVPAANFTYSGTNAAPTVFTVNGTVCNGAHTPPAVTLTSPAAGASYTAPASVPMAATASASDGATITKVEFYSGTTLACTATASPFTCTWSGVAAGSYSITAKAYDSQGATSTSAPAGITVASTPSVTVNPATLSVGQGATGTLAVSLSSAPTANVTVTTARTSGNTGLSVTAGGSLTFTTANWSTPQNVTITADAAGTGAATFTSTATGYTAGTATVTETGALGVYEQRFMTLYNKIMNPANGYFSPQGIPYHSVETLIIEAPDYGHETTSEAWSYYLWITAMYGNLSKDWTKFTTAWSLMEQYMIPTHADQPTNSFYTPNKSATYAAEHDFPDQYPSPIDTSVPTGADPIAAELQTAYGTQDVYGMHWLEDVDNKYGFGNTPGGGCELGPNTGKPSYINSYQRGPQEGVFETIPQPTCDNFTYGGPNGYLDLFIKDSSYAKQWKYTDAPDADARAIQAAYWADTWAKAQGNGAAVASTVAKAGKMGDYLRYSFFDKYFKQIGNCTSPTACPAVTSGRGAEHYLLSWYYAWGGSAATSGGWAWRIGDSAAHQGYQNPLAAYALITDPALKPASATGVSDWTTSLGRQLEFYRWLQSNEGAIAGGATNSWGGAYATPPTGDSTFYGMYYDPAPVFHDPDSNQWFGFQAWSLERVAEYYYTSGDAKAKAVLDKWVSWALSKTTINANGTYQFPSTLSWSGQPDTWNATTPGANAGLHVTVVDYTNDVGVAAAYAKTLSYYAAKSGNAQAKTTAQAILDDMWANNQDALGVSVPETRADYNRVTQVYSTSNTNRNGVYVPAGFSGKTPTGDTIAPGATFLSIRSWYTSDPQWSKVQTYLNGGSAPVFNYHRFWAQTDIALAQAVYGQLFGV
jgi:hypothetical protein